MFLVIITTLFAFIMMITIAIVRVKSSNKPTNRLKILLPPLLMSTGALMFVFPYFRLEKTQVFEALSVGVIFSLLLIYTSKLEVKDGEIYLIPSKAFIYILFGLIFIRTIAKLFIGSQVSIGETGGIFFLLGFGMIFTWRIVMFFKYIHLEKKLIKKDALLDRER